MLQKALVLVIVLASIAICTGCGTTSNHYVYATIPAANQIIAYREDPNSGVLTQLSGSPYSVGDGAISLVLHPSGKYLYVANPGQLENDISQFTIASDGTLTEPNARVSVAPNASQPTLLAMDPAGTYLYVMNVGSSNISVFSIASGTGVLTQVANSPVQIGSPLLNMQLTPSGNFLYVSTASLPLGSIIGFSVNAGQLSLLGTTPTDGINPHGLAIDLGGTFLYAANGGASNSISVFTISSSGSLAEVQGSPINEVNSNSDPFTLILDPSGTYLYVANLGSSNVAVYSITSGLPSPLTSSTTTFGPFATEGNPSFLAADPSGKYLFVGNQPPGSPGIQAFGVSSGNLTALSTYSVGNTPSSIAVLQ